MKNLLRLNLQQFAEEGEGTTEEQSTTATDASENTAEQTVDEKKKDGNEQKIPYDRFKQKVDEANALKEKLAKFEAEQAEKERQELEEREEYKTLYEQAVQQAEQAKQEAVQVRKSALLSGAGYSEEQAKLLVKLVEGETEEEITESINVLKATVPAQDNYGDPSAFNGAREKPEHVGADELGVKVFERIKNKIF